MPSLLQSCETEQYVHHEKSQVVGTAWGQCQPRISPVSRAHSGELPQPCSLSFERNTPTLSQFDEAVSCSCHGNCLMVAGRKKLSKEVNSV